MAEEQKANETLTRKPLGDKEDDPQISRIYQTEQDCSSSIKKAGFGSLGTSKKDIIRNKNKTGFIRIYSCDNKNFVNCKKELRFKHIFDERDSQFQPVFSIESKGTHAENC